MTELAAPLRAALEAALRNCLGEAFRLDGVVPQPGGHTNQCWQLRGGKQRFFLKVREAAPPGFFSAEIKGLEALQGCAQLRIPQPICAGSNDTSAFLVLEYLDLIPLGPHGARAGTALAALHAMPQAHYGWAQDSFLGSTLQNNRPCENWPLFFAQQRLQPLLQALRAQGLRSPLLEQGEHICAKLAGLFLEYRPQPALLHGDLWHGNIAALADGTPVLFDPACYCGDREADLAMSELFGGLPASFYLAYRQAAPLDAAYETRKTLYNLYHILNHLLLFGPAYLGQAERMARTLSQLLRH